MRIFWLFCALGALLGCRTVSEPSGTAIALFCSTYQGAKTESLTVGEEVAVFAGPEGTEDYFLEAAQFLVGSDGRSLNYGSTVYYPDPKQAVRFLAYFPYHKGTFSVPTDQSTATALKQADLCGATASTTPVATPVALEFRHLMARLVITTNEPTTRISFPNAVASGVLHAATAEFVLGSNKTDISTTSNELIVPVQPLSRLVLTVAGVEYVFDGSVSLEAGRTTTLDLTLHPSTKTATLSGSSVTDWGSVNGEGNPTHAVSNTLLLHWPSLPQGATPDQVIFTIGGTDYAVSNGITYANHTFTVLFASSALRYPYTISKITFYQSGGLGQSCANLLGGVIYKLGASTLGIKDVASAVLINRGGYKLWWATGNLISDGSGGCKIGDSTDVGLQFNRGGIIAYRNGVTGDGTGAWVNAIPNMFTTIAVPKEYTGSTAYPGPIYQGVLTGVELPSSGTGDPCRYYLKGQWRLATWEELSNQLTGVSNYPIHTPLPGAKIDMWADPVTPNLCHLFAGQLTLRLSCSNSGDDRWIYGWYFPGDGYGQRYVALCSTTTYYFRDWDPANGQYSLAGGLSGGRNTIPIRCVHPAE